MTENKPITGIEKIKTESDNLRGTILQSLQDDLTGAIREDDQAVIKFHGIYQQDNRDRREERAEKKLERLYSFMIRLRLPGGFLNSSQWSALDEVSEVHSSGVIKITSRQTVQLHGLIKSGIKPTIQSFNKAALDSIATCGDINRNVLCSSHPKASPIHRIIFEYANAISEMLMPRTRAYYEIWLDEEKILDKKDEEDLLYQDCYMPRKFKIAIAIPPNNDVDVFTNDIGLIAVIEDNQLKGFNIAIGGGMSTTHGNPSTYARLGTILGFVEAGEKTLKTIYEVLTIQRDFGNRSDRKLARLKYTLDKYGVEWYKENLELRTGFALQSAKPYSFSERRDYYEWFQNLEGLWYYTVFVENGRITDDEGMALKTALREVASQGKANFRFTANQNIIISDIATQDKPSIHAILEHFKVIRHTRQASPVRKNSMGCVALPTCPLALAEGQRYLPSLISRIEELLYKYQLEKEDIIIRMTGCPNGCARPSVAEIGFVGTAIGKYHMYLGGDKQGLRMNKIYKENLNELNILIELDKLFSAFSNEKMEKESFGDYFLRSDFASENKISG